MDNRMMLYPALLLILVVATAAAAYSMWSQRLGVSATVETGEVDLAFSSGSLTYLDACGLPPGYGLAGGYDWNATNFPQKGGEQIADGEDVGCTHATMMDMDGDGDYDAINVTLVNVYPWYYTHVGFTVCNDGTVPIKIWRVIVSANDGDRTYYELNEQELNEGEYLDLNNDGKPDIVLWWGDNFGVQLHPGQCAGISFDITVLQQAPQGSTLSFTISLQAVQWNEYSIPTSSP